MQVETHWKGRPVSQLTRKELIEALEQMAAFIKVVSEAHEHDLKILLQ